MGDWESENVFSVAALAIFQFLRCEMFSYLVKSLCFLFSVSIIIVPFLKFLTVFELIFVQIIFCMRNGDSFVRGVSSSDSNMMNFGNRGSGCILSSELSDNVRSFEGFFSFCLGCIFELHK